jgi:hypothetical protein
VSSNACTRWVPATEVAGSRDAHRGFVQATLDLVLRTGCRRARLYPSSRASSVPDEVAADCRSGS